MILFNWRKIYLISKGSSKNILTIIEGLTNKSCPYSLKDPYARYYGIDFKGSSFLLNPIALLINRWRYKDADIVRYIGLASMRSYSDYLIFKETTLDFLIVQDKKELIDTNPLLQLKNNKVLFKFEEELAGDKNGNRI